MSRWSRDPEGAADALILRALDGIPVSGCVLAVNQSRSLPALLRQRGAICEVWNRRLADGPPATAWPSPGPYDLAFVRLPKARDEQAMTLHAVLSVLRDGGRLILYGGNDEGIRSVASLLEEVGRDVTELAVRGRGRVLAAGRPVNGEGLRAPLEAWREVSRIDLAGSAREWVSYPGCFAAGRLDEGTALLLSALPRLPRGARVLDYGCGTGAIAAAALAQEPGLKVDAMDSDAVALEAVRENAPAARPILGTRLADAGRRGYAAILSNPPLHQGIAEDRTPLDRLVADAPSHLSPGGLMQLVLQRRVALERPLAERFTKVETVAETGSYRVWRAQL
jgi:16S rRNA (guanine1207-N2)-methyltransferase